MRGILAAVLAPEGISFKQTRGAAATAPPKNFLDGKSRPKPLSAFSMAPRLTLAAGDGVRQADTPIWGLTISNWRRFPCSYFARREFLKECFAAVLLVAALSDVAAAEVASDNELYAAYCIGVLQDRQQAGRKLWAEYEQTAASQDDAREIREARDKDLKDLDQKLSRFRTYLAVRGFRPGGGRDPQAFTGIQVALQRGRSVSLQCSQHHEKNCTSRCASDLVAPPGAISKCDQCRAENAECRSSERCLQADNLPF